MDVCGHIPVWSGERIERTNARGRHRYCEAFKTWMVEQALLPGMTTAGLAMRNQVNANQLRRWVSLHQIRGAVALAPTTGAHHLLPVTIVPEPAASGTPIQVRADSAIEIEFGGAVVRVRDGADAGTLRAVIDALRESPR